jgi:trehalose 6-phosphate phosphatase
MMSQLERLPEFDRRWAVFLDFDGTLAEFAEAPHLVEVDAALPGTLMRLHDALGGALAVISGRPVREIDAFLAPLSLPTAGLHGLEWRHAQRETHDVHTANGDIVQVREALEAFAASIPGLQIEDKRRTVALHYRRAPDAEAACREAVTEALAGHEALCVLAGKMVFEIKPRGIDKGTAITRFMSEAPFGGRIPLFAGDDVTDEDGFAAVNARSGISIRVGDSRSTLARFRTDGVPALLSWLHGLLPDSQIVARRSARP